MGVSDVSERGGPYGFYCTGCPDRSKCGACKVPLVVGQRQRTRVLLSNNPNRKNLWRFE